MKQTIHNLYALEQLSGGKTAIHRLHPIAKLLATAVFVVLVISFDRYATLRLAVYVFYPTLMMAVSETPYHMLMKRFLLTLPFCLFAGVSNLLLDTNTAYVGGGVAVSFGTVSLVSILLKAYLCVMAVLILVATTPFSGLTAALRRLSIPQMFITVFEMTYRYLAVLAGEAAAMRTAYALRGAGRQAVEIRDMGSFAGQLLIRSIDRAERVYHAMVCRGYAPGAQVRATDKITLKDIGFLIAVCVLCVVFRIIGPVELFLKIFGGILSC